MPIRVKDEATNDFVTKTADKLQVGDLVLM